MVGRASLLLGGVWGERLYHTPSNNVGISLFSVIVIIQGEFSVSSHAEIQFPLNQLTDDRVKISEHIKVIQDMPHRSRCDRADQSARCILDLDPPAWRESNNHDCALRRSLGGGLKTHLDLGQRAEGPPGFRAAGRLPTW